MFVLRKRLIGTGGIRRFVFLRRIKPSVKRAVAVALLIIVFTVSSVNLYIRAIPLAVLSYETVARGEIEKTVLEAAEKAIGESNESFYTRVTDSMGNVVSVSADSKAISGLCKTVVNNIYKAVDRKGCIKVKVPVGSTTGNEFLYGRGPSVSVRVIPYIAAYADVESNFTDAGINQTLHIVMLTVKTEVTLVCAGNSAELSTENRIVVSEEIIIGGVPDRYIK